MFMTFTVGRSVADSLGEAAARTARVFRMPRAQSFPGEFPTWLDPKETLLKDIHVNDRAVWLEWEAKYEGRTITLWTELGKQKLQVQTIRVGQW